MFSSSIITRLRLLATLDDDGVVVGNATPSCVVDNTLFISVKLKPNFVVPRTQDPSMNAWNYEVGSRKDGQVTGCYGHEATSHPQDLSRCKASPVVLVAPVNGTER